jgi:hypothetical protein
MPSETRQFDVFNGDADGICALHQLRLEHPAQAMLTPVQIARLPFWSVCRRMRVTGFRCLIPL